MRDIVTENQVRRLMGERDLLLSAIAPADYAKIEAQLVAIAESPDTPVPAVPETLSSPQGDVGVGGSVPQNLPELIGGPVRPRGAKELSHSQDKTHSRNADEALKPTSAPAVPAQEAPREICPACGSSFKSVRQFAYSTDRTARAPCGDKWHEPQAGAQVPSQDGRPGTVGYVLANLDSIFDSYCFCPDAKSWIICILIAQLRSIQSYATEAAKTPITREDMHDPLKAQTFYDEAKGFERLVMSEINPKGKS